MKVGYIEVGKIKFNVHWEDDHNVEVWGPITDGPGGWISVVDEFHEKNIDMVLLVAEQRMKNKFAIREKNPEWEQMLGPNPDGLYYQPSLLRCPKCGEEGNDYQYKWICGTCKHQVAKVI